MTAYENISLSFYQINAYECTHILLKHHCISILYYSMFQPSKCHLDTFQNQGKQNESPEIKFWKLKKVISRSKIIVILIRI